jgi:hypothetical protein
MLLLVCFCTAINKIAEASRRAVLWVHIKVPLVNMMLYTS